MDFSDLIKEIYSISLLKSGFHIAVVIVLAWVALNMARKLSQGLVRFVARQKEDEEFQKRTRTLGDIVRYIIVLAILAVASMTVLKELGIDISHHRSKAVSEIPAAEVDTVITLCGEEECPLFLGKATRLHWGLPDPAAAQGTEQERLNAFRQTRDELRRRIQAFLEGKDEGGRQ